MYQFPYAEVLDEAPKLARERERHALERSIELLEAAEREGPHTRAAVDALVFVRQLWAIFIEDLANPENALAQPMRADLISIGLWIMREAEDIRLERKSSLKGLLEVSRVICEGLR